MELGKINPMESDLSSIEWLESFAASNTPESSDLSYAWKILKLYYDECLDELKKMGSDESPFEDSNELNEAYDLVLQKLENKTFYDLCIEFGISNETIDTLKRKKLNKEELNISEKWAIAKIVRYYNMRLKLSHSARITYIALSNLECAIPSDTNDNMLLLKKAVVLSSLLHDIGRFYQAIHYNTLYDNTMKNAEEVIILNPVIRFFLNDEEQRLNIKTILVKRLNEKKLSEEGQKKLFQYVRKLAEKSEDFKKKKREAGLSVDHAIAGYYYALSSAYVLQKISEDADIEAKKKMIIEVISAIVVRFHQQSNLKLSFFESMDSIDCLRDKDVLEELFQFFSAAYDNANLMNDYVKSKFSSSHKKFIDKFLSKIYDKFIDSTALGVSEGFSVNIKYLKQMKEELNASISAELEKIGHVDVEIICDNLVKIINKKMQKVTRKSIKLDGTDKNEILNLLNSMKDYDIAESVSRMLKNPFSNKISSYFIKIRRT